MEEIMEEVLFRAYCIKEKAYIAGFNMVHYHQYYNKGLKKSIYRYSTHWDEDEYILEQYTGLKDKNGVKGFFDSDIWEIKDFKYNVKWCDGFQTKSCDLKFILKKGLLQVEYELIDPPEDLTRITLNTIFNLENKNGKRIFVDDNRKKLEIIGTIHEMEKGVECGKQ